MHEKRNFLLMLIMIGALIWGILAWFVMDPEGGLVGAQRIASIGAFFVVTGWLVYAMKIQDKLPDHLMEVVGSTMYYDVEGLSFMPIVRVREGQAELCMYYQNRFENPVQAIVHIRPLQEGFYIRPGVVDIHFAFKSGGGDFGVIHQPIAVPEHLQGDVINVHLAAAAYFPRSQGARLRKNKAGFSVGTLAVDWGGAAFKTGVHEVSGEIELLTPTTIRLPMPKAVQPFLTDAATWRQERIEVGVET
jgi:hypothetical protein